jgi:SAM-dependent methyltransferase
MEPRYVFDQAWQHERARLAGIEAMWEPGTRALLAPLVHAGARCLEVGGGGGATVEWLAERVGAGGSVVATDLDTRFLAPLASDVVEVLEHDITTGPPGTGFDLVHARLVLEHLPAHDDALGHMVAALRPGGSLVVEDYDWTSFGTDPPDEVSERAARGIISFMATAGFDPVFGRRLLSLVERRPVEAVRGEGRMLVVRDDEPGFAFFRLAFEALRDGAVAAGRLDPADADAFAARMRAGGLRMLSPVVVAVAARRVA